MSNNENGRLIPRVEPVAPVAPVTDAPVAPVTRTRRTRTTARNTASVVVTTIAALYRAVRTVAGLADVAAFVESVSPVAAHPVNAPGKNVGRFTGRRVVAFQNDTFLENETRKLTDAQLLAVWRAEFPSATGAVFQSPDMRVAVRIVAGARASFNKNGHGESHRVPSGFVSVAYTK